MGVTDEQATQRDEIGNTKSRIEVTFDTTIDSDNARIEVKHRLYQVGKPVIAAISNDSLGRRYRDWLVPLIESAPATTAPSLLVTYDSLSDWAHGLKKAITIA